MLHSFGWLSVAYKILIHSLPQVTLLTVDFDEDLVNVEGITITAVLSL